MPQPTKGALAFNAFLALVFAAAVFVGAGYHHRARIAPLVVAIPGLLVSVGLLVRDLRVQAKASRPAGEPALAAETGKHEKGNAAKDAAPHTVQKFLGPELNPFFWLAVLILMLFAVGFAVAIPVYLFLYLRVRSQEGTVFSIVFSVIAWAALYMFFDRLLHIPLYQGIIANYLL